jgi:Tol biopolymer transport system component
MKKSMQFFLVLCVIFTFIQSCEKDKCPVPVSTNSGTGLIAFAEWDSTLKTHIFTMTPLGENKKQLTSGTAEYWMPNWSPDGNKIAYASKSSIVMNIYTMNADGSNQQQLTNTGANIAPNWSPDGTAIAYAHMEPGGMVMNIWLMNADGTNKKALTADITIDNNVPYWSPDGTKIAFTSNRNGGQYQIWTINLNDSTFTQLTTAYYDSIHAFWIEQKVPSYSPDGKYIAYWEGLEGSNSNTNTPWVVRLMNANGTDKKILAPGDDPSWSPDSKTIIHVWKTNCPDSVSIGGISPDGSNEHLVFITNCGFGRISWKQ